MKGLSDAEVLASRMCDHQSREQREDLEDAGVGNEEVLDEEVAM